MVKEIELMAELDFKPAFELLDVKGKIEEFAKKAKATDLIATILLAACLKQWGGKLGFDAVTHVAIGLGVDVKAIEKEQDREAKETAKGTKDAKLGKETKGKKKRGREVKRPDPDASAKQVEEWNAKYPVGTKVRRYELVHPRGGNATVTETRSEAWLMGGHSAVVLLKGHAGGHMLDAVEVIPPITGGNRHD